MTVRQVMFLTKVNNRLHEIEQLQDIYTLIAAGGRQLEELSFTSMVNRLKYGQG